MTSFEYNYQNPSCLCFLIQICQSRWGVRNSSLNLHKKRTNWKILVVVVMKITSSCKLLSYSSGVLKCNRTNLKSTTANYIDHLSNNKLIDGILEVTLDLAWLWQQLCMLDMVGNFFTVQLLELGHFEEDYPITTFLKTKDSQVFCKWTWLWELLPARSGKFTRF